MKSEPRYFSGDTQCALWGLMRNAEFAERFPNSKGVRVDGFSRYVGYLPDNSLVPVTRIIFYSKTPSGHKCDARCMHAKGRNCECSCGGKNHGLGSL